MNAPKKLVLECGANSLDYLGDRQTPLVARVERLKRDAMHDEGIDLEIVIYAGSSGAHRGGRMVPCDNGALPDLVAMLNAAGIPFLYALNGGLLLDDTALPDESETTVLQCMAASGENSGLKNKVVITRQALLPFLRQSFPGLEVVASCIQQTSPRDCGPYASKLQEYDYVVPLNQHTTCEFLRCFEGQADRLIVFLLLTCGSNDIRCCFGDYLTHERVPPERMMQQLTTVDFSGLLPTALAPQDSGCNWPGAALIRRQHDLIGLIRMGINNFKVTRAQYLMADDYRNLLRLMREHGPA